MIKVSAEESSTAFSVSQPQLTAYDAQPQASRAVKRSQELISGSEEEERREPLQMRTSSLLNKHEGTKALPIVLDDEDCASNSVAAEVAGLQANTWSTYNNAAFKGEERKRRRVAYGCEEPWTDRALDCGAVVVN